VREWIADLNDQYGSFRFELEDLETGASSRVLALGRIEVEGRGPAAGLEQPAAWVIEVRDGQLTRMELYADQEEARVVAGVAH
jgi:ketosteroid isomerase-like protein